MHLRSHLLVAATVVNWLVALAWIIRTAELIRNLPRIPDLLTAAFDRSLPPASGRPSLAVIVPACNEEEAIGDTLRSLLAQQGIALEIIAVNDRSTDRTGAILDGIAAESATPQVGVTLKVLHIQKLPAGWMGKQHALACGVAETQAPYLLFTDGDIFFRPDALRRAMQFAVAESADHVVLLPTPIIKSFGEHMMLSALQVYSAFAVRLWKVSDPDAKDRLGVGAFNLVRREAYDAIGGFAALRMEVLEDVRLAVEIKRHGLRQRVAFGTGLVTLHWASGLGGIVRNVTKNLFAGFRFSVPAVLFACLILVLFGVYPVVCFFGPLAMQLASALTLLSVIALYFLFRRKGGSSPAFAFLFPVATVFLVYALLRSMFVTLARGAVVWRGTSYPLKELRRRGGPMF
jgi:glycosyltransferase involved in cell wall biosynthesis